MSLSEALKKKYEYGQTIEIFLGKNPGEGRRHFSLFRQAYIRNWKMFIKRPAHSTGLIFMKTCEFFVGGLGFVENKITRYRLKRIEKPIVLTTPGDLAKVKIIEEIIQLTAKKQGTVLDLGCGVGWCINSLSKFGTVIALEISKKKLKMAKSNHGQANFILADAQYLPFKARSFDIVIIKDVLEHILNDEGVIDEVSQVSKNDSLLLLYVPISLKEATISIEALIHRLAGYSIDAEVGHVRRYTVRGIIKILEKKGFKVTIKRYFAHVTVGLLTILLVISHKKLMKQKMLKSSYRLIETFYYIVESLCKFEYKILKGYPGAGVFILASKTLRRRAPNIKLDCMDR